MQARDVDLCHAPAASHALDVHLAVGASLALGARVREGADHLLRAVAIADTQPRGAGDGAHVLVCFEPEVVDRPEAAEVHGGQLARIERHINGCREE